MVLHSLALRDVVPLWVESVFILDRSEGLAVFAGVSSSVNGHLSVLWQSGHWSFFPLLYVSSSFGWVHHVRMFFPSSFALLAFSLRVQFPEWSVQPLVAVPWGEPSSVSIVTLLYSFRLTQTSTSRTVLIFVVCLRFLFPTLLFTLSA